MGVEQEQLDLEGRFNSQWSALGNGYSVIYDNSPISPPDSGPWLSFRIFGVDSKIAGIGGSAVLHRATNFIEIIIHDDKGAGTARAKGLADSAAAIFRDARVTGYRFRSPWVKRLGELEGWYQIAITIPFQRDESF